MESFLKLIFHGKVFIHYEKFFLIQQTLVIVMLFNHHVLVERVEIVISVELVEQVNESRQLFLLTDVVILVRLIALE